MSIAYYCMLKMLVDRKMSPVELRKVTGITPNTMTKIRNNLTVSLMMSGMYEAHICDAIRKSVSSEKKVTTSRAIKESFFLTESAVSTDIRKKAIEETGYTCQRIASAPVDKKGLFGRI